MLIIVLITITVGRVKFCACIICSDDKDDYDIIVHNGALNYHELDMDNNSEGRSVQYA